MPNSGDIWMLLGLLGVTVPLVALARRANVSYPIVLVLGGLVLGFIPGLPQIQLDPNAVLLFSLPPLLYWAAITAPTDTMRANAGQIGVLAIGLVLATTVAVAVVAHAAIVGLAWPMAFVLGAIVAPTDELASTPVLERLKMPRHVIAIVLGESLLNDASALILYAVAVGAAVTGAFNLGGAFVQFVVAALGGIVVGVVVGWIAVEGWRRITDTQLQVVISFSLPFFAYLVAQRCGFSGVLAVVFAGLFANRYTPRVITPAARLQAIGFWDSLVFITNAMLFVLVGLQLHALAGAVLAEYSWQRVLAYAAIVNVTIVGIRFAWLMLEEAIPVIGTSEHPEGDYKHALITSWSGLRGAVSLAAALALPVMTPLGPLPHRSLVVFLTFSVILVTLVGGGLTLPILIRRLALPPSTEEEDELAVGLQHMSEAALARLAKLEREGRIEPQEAYRLRRRYEHRRRHLDGSLGDEESGLAVERELLETERTALISLRDRGEIDNTALRRLQHVLDIAEERVSHHSVTG